MKLSDVFPPEAILLGLEHRTKGAALAEMVHRLVELGQLGPEAEEGLTEAVLARERTASTTLWDGMAMPNVRTSLTDRFLGVLAVEPRGVDFDAIGGGPVKVLFLLVAPLERRMECVELLGKTAAVGKNKGLLLQLAGCRSAQDVHHLLLDIDRS